MLRVKFYEQLLDLMLGFTLARARSVILFLAVLLAIAWVIDWRTGYSDYARLERAVVLAERLDTLERRGVGSKELSELRANLVDRLQSLNARDARPVFPMPTSPSPWYSQPWAKAVAGGLPWFIISCFAMPALLRLDRNGWAGFIVFQGFTAGFAFLNWSIPATGRWWIDLALVPGGFFFVFGMVPVALAVAVPAFKKVRDSSLRKAIMNNLRQLAAASCQYYLENAVTRVAFAELVGPGKYLKEVNPIDGERYDDLVFEQGKAISVKRSSGEIVSYEF